MEDPFDLDRFVVAQDPVMAAVEAELVAGDKCSHWMWFVFPQLRALGRSPTAVRFGITGRAEADAYLAHPVLGPRLIRCTELMVAARPKTARQILGDVDALKFRSSMALFAELDAAPAIFATALDAFYDGPDLRTLEELAD